MSSPIRDFETYLEELEQIADHAEGLEKHVDSQYKQILVDEVRGYRDLIALQRKRLDRK